MRNLCVLILTAVATLAGAGCSTTQKVTGSPLAKQINPKSAFVVVKGGKSADMDLKLQNALTKMGMTVTTGDVVFSPMKTDILVRYDDNWNWDIGMYLTGLNIKFFDKNQNILVDGDWRSTVFFHGYPDSAKVTENLVKEMVENMGVSPKVTRN